MGKIWNDEYRSSVIGRVDSDGRVWNNEYSVGRVDSNGNVWNDEYSGSIIGRVDSDGGVWADSSSVGNVDSDGNIRQGGRIVGRAEGGKLEGGAALLLLVGKQDGDKQRKHFPKMEDGFFIWIVSMLLYLIFENWGGRIGAILGVAFIIIVGIIDEASDLSFKNSPLFTIVIAIITGFILGIVGAIINLIVFLIKKLIKKIKG